MTFEAHEESIEQGAPVELYRFTVYGQHFYYTNAATDQLYDAITYLSVVGSIEHDEINDTDKMERQNITLTVPKDFPILAFYDSAPPSDVILLQIKMVHRDDEDSETVTFWNGRVMNGLRQGNRGQLYCENVYSSMKRSGLRRLYGRLCPHVLYGPACGLQDSAFRIQVNVDAVGGLELQSAILSTYPDGRFAGGIVEFEATPSRIERRGIKSHVGSLLTMTHAIPDLDALDQVWVYLGCQHTITDCHQTFNNKDNYGGWPNIPRLNPMGQSSVF